MSLDPTILKDAVTVGAFYIEGGVRSFAEFSAKMIEEFGAGIERYLRPAYDELRKRTDIDTTGMDGVAPVEAKPPVPEPQPAAAPPPPVQGTAEEAAKKLRQMRRLQFLYSKLETARERSGGPRDETTPEEREALRLLNNEMNRLGVPPTANPQNIKNRLKDLDKQIEDLNKQLARPVSTASGVNDFDLSKMNRVRDVLKKEVLRMAHGAFVTQLVFTIGAYAGVTVWLNAIRKTAAIEFVWVLIAAQLLLFLSIFFMCFRRANQCATRHTWLIFIPLFLSRVDDWEIVVIPALAVVMIILSARSRNVPPEHQPLLPPDSDTPEAGENRRVANALLIKDDPVLQPEKANVVVMPNVPNDSGNQQSAELTGYSLLSKELEAGTRDEVLWLKSFSEADGNEAKAQAAYNRQRARTLADEFNAKQKDEERAESLEREARENERKAKADAAQAEERRFIGEVNALLGTCPEFGSKLPSRNVLLSVSSDMDKVLPKLVVAGKVELAERVKNSKARIDALLNTHEEHRVALEKALPLVDAKKIAPIRKMMNYELRGRFEDLDYTPFQERIDKAQQRNDLRVTIVILVIAAFLIGLGIYNSMVVAQQGVANAKESIASSSVKDAASDDLEKEPSEGAAYGRALLGGTLEKDIVKTPPVRLPVEPPSDLFASTMPQQSREPVTVQQLETPAAPPTLPPQIESSEEQVTVSADLSSTVRIVKIKRGDSLSVRSGPGISFQIIGEIPAQATGIRLLGHGQGKPAWFPVVWKDVQGWVNGSFLDYE